MSLLLRVYYIVLIVLAVCSVYLTMKVSKIPLDAFLVLFIKVICRQRKQFTGSTHQNKKLNVATQIKSSDGSTTYKKIQQEPVSELEAAMHYIDFQKSNWYDYGIHVI